MAKSKSFYGVFASAAKSIGEIAGVTCRYVRGEDVYRIRTYWNEPKDIHWSVGEYGVDSGFREWYLNPAELKRKGIGHPQEFDRIIFAGATWEVYRDGGQAFTRDATPDIVVLTRLIKTEV